MKIHIADERGLTEKFDVDGLRITLESGAVFDISLASMTEKDDGLRISAKHPGNVYAACVIPESSTTFKIKPLVID